jgi:hypothetical protein
MQCLPGTNALATLVSQTQQSTTDQLLDITLHGSGH